MAEERTLLASEQLLKANKAVGDTFRAFRQAARMSGPLDKQTVEFILMAGFTAAGHQSPFKNHAKRALEAGVAKEALQQTVMLTLGATSVLPAVANALRWIEEVEREVNITKER